MVKIDRRDMTRERLLDAAENLFAQKGYSAVRVREITRAARTNLAAVNYHFQTKKNLYLEVFKYRWIPRAVRVQENFWATLGPLPPASPAPIVQALTGAFLEGFADDDQRHRHHQLMVREMAQPSEAFELIVGEVMQPFFTRLSRLLRPLMDPSISDEALMLNLMTIFGMVLHFNFARAAVSRLSGRAFDPVFQARLSEHLVEFSLHGLSGQIQEDPSER